MNNRLLAESIATVISLCTVFTAALVRQNDNPQAIRVQIERNTIVKSNFDFIHEHWKEEKLERLIEKESYHLITASTQVEYFMRICAWVHRQWQWSVPDPYPLCNAVDILADIRAGKTGGFCGQYAYVFADVLKSLGFYDVRYVELWSPGGQSHFTVEVWCDQYEKWIMLDPDQALYYTLGDSPVPANVFEIRQAILHAAPALRETRIDPDTAIEHRAPRDVYANFAVSLRSDLMRHNKPLTIQDRFDMFLFYRDDHTQASAFTRFGAAVPYRHITSRREDVYFDCNRVRVEYSINPEKRAVTLEFFTDQSMANFKEFSVSLDQGNTWKPSDYRLTLSDQHGDRNVWVRPVNMVGRPGVTTKVHLTFPDPAPPKR